MLSVDLHLYELCCFSAEIVQKLRFLNNSNIKNETMDFVKRQSKSEEC
jgi:hypothetical protein